VAASGTQSPEPGPELEPDDSPHHPMAAWFADLRRRRGEHYARRPAPARPRRRALITIVNNESFFLALWLAYYSRFFAAQDIYVIDNETTDGSLDRGGFQRIPAARDGLDNLWMVQTVENLQHELLRRYDVVVFTDIDEFIAPAPRVGTLGDYLDRFDEEWVNCLGYEILHQPDREGPLDTSRPILEQRHHWFYNDAYSKAAIATAPLRWRPGFHGRADLHFNLDPDLRLIHLHRVDYAACLARHRMRSSRPWSRYDADRGWGAHNFITESEAFAHWFAHDSCFENLEIQLETIHPSWRGVL
jgi:hypothetical protein